ncbi:MAG: D-alanyl-D-alanine carboxypeptidase [Oscillospiraceae bacterium]|nr:D-alanyl-D-alanine carboxypeptidase [Oscillospiraceae bacterium]
MRFSQRVCAFLLSVALLPACIPLGACAQAEEPEIISEAAVLMDAQTGQILYEKNMDERMYPASITKILTGYLALKYGNPADELTMSEEAFRQVPRTSSHIGLLPEEVITMKDALYALTLVSANDAAVAIAENISGSVEEFADLMNEEAAQMGAYNTHFVNPNGMPDENHYTTARDMALITAEALKMPDFYTFFGASKYELPKTNLSEARALVSKNKFIDGSMDCPGLLMSKTGWTSSALGTLVTVAKRGSTTLIAVAMKSPELEDKYTDTQALFAYGFGNFQRTRLSRNLMEDKMRQQGMGENGCLEGYTPVDVLLPKAADPKEIILTVPGGFDAGLGVSTVPVSVDIPVGGKVLHLADLLLTLAEAAPLAEAEPAPAAAVLPQEESSVHPGGLILLGLAAVVGLLGLAARKKVHS